MFNVSPAFVGVAIPAMVLICGVAIVITAIIVNGNQKELKHRERIIALEKGLELPREEKRKKRPRYLVMRAWGFVIFLTSIGLIVALLGVHGMSGGLWGLMPLGLGAGLLIAAYLEQKEGHDGTE